MVKYYKDLDLYDKKILYELDINARATASEIAKRIRLPKETVNFRIKRLFGKGHISHFYSIINASRFGHQYYKIFFKFNKLTVEIERKIIEYILNEKSCANLRIMEGSYDICFVTMHTYPEGLKEFMYRFNKHFGEYILLRSMHTIIASYKLNQKFLFSGKSLKRVFYHGKSENYALDDIDMKIIKILSTNARMKLVDIAYTIHIDPKLVRYHIKKLEREKVLVGYFTALNLKFFQRTFIQIDIGLKNPDYLRSMIEFFDQTNACVFASQLLGRYDLSVEIYVENDQHLRKILGEFKDKFLENYIFYDVSRVYHEYVINWSPFDAYRKESSNH